MPPMSEQMDYSLWRGLREDGCLMVHYCRSSWRVDINAWKLTLTTLLVALSGVIASPRADAVVVYQQAAAVLVTGDGHGNNNHINVRAGNGKFNKTNSTLFGPTVNRGVQQIANTNVSGKTITKVSCRKKHRRC